MGGVGLFFVLEVDFGIVVLVGRVGYWGGFGFGWFKWIFGGGFGVWWVVGVVVGWCVFVFWLEIFYGCLGFD